MKSELARQLWTLRFFFSNFRDKVNHPITASERLRSFRDKYVLLIHKKDSREICLYISKTKFLCNKWVMSIVSHIASANDYLILLLLNFLNNNIRIFDTSYRRMSLNKVQDQIKNMNLLFVLTAYWLWQAMVLTS